MIYTDLTKKAINLAYKAHMGQKDKMGIPYILHPMHIAESMDTENECLVAILHDVIEDTYYTLDDLKKEFPKEVTDASALLTHNSKDSYMKYIRKVKTNPLATKVKIADLKHNMDTSRLGKIRLKDRFRIYKYQRALAILKGDK